MGQRRRLSHSRLTTQLITDLIAGSLVFIIPPSICCLWGRVKWEWLTKVFETVNLQFNKMLCANENLRNALKANTVPIKLHDDLELWYLRLAARDYSKTVVLKGGRRDDHCSQKSGSLIKVIIGGFHNLDQDEAGLIGGGEIVSSMNGYLKTVVRRTLSRVSHDELLNLPFLRNSQSTRHDWAWDMICFN